MLLLQDSPLGRLAHCAEMALIVLSDELGVVNGFLISPQQRQFARSHAALLRDDLVGGWVIRSVRPLRLLHSKTRARKSVVPSDGAPGAAASGRECVDSHLKFSNEKMDNIFKTVFTLSQQWNAQPECFNDRADEDLKERSGRRARLYSVTVSSIVRNRKSRHIEKPTPTIGHLGPSPTDQIKKRPAARKRSPSPDERSEHEEEPPAQHPPVEESDATPLSPLGASYVADDE
jgi:hypothetical protein